MLAFGSIVEIFYDLNQCDFYSAAPILYYTRVLSISSCSPVRKASPQLLMVIVIHTQIQVIRVDSRLCLLHFATSEPVKERHYPRHSGLGYLWKALNILSLILKGITRLIFLGIFGVWSLAVAMCQTIPEMVGPCGGLFRHVLK